MSSVQGALSTFVVAAPEQVAAALTGPEPWVQWARGLVVVDEEDRGPAGVRRRVEGAVAGTAEVWLEPVQDGVVVHWFLTGSCRSRRPRSLADRYRHDWLRVVLGVKDRLEAGRPPGVKPSVVAAEE